MHKTHLKVQTARHVHRINLPNLGKRFGEASFGASAHLPLQILCDLQVPAFLRVVGRSEARDVEILPNGPVILLK